VCQTPATDWTSQALNIEKKRLRRLQSHSADNNPAYKMKSASISLTSVSDP